MIQKIKELKMNTIINQPMSKVNDNKIIIDVPKIYNNIKIYDFDLPFTLLTALLSNTTDAFDDEI